MPQERSRFTRSVPNTFVVIYGSSTPQAVQSAVEYVLNLVDSWLELSSAAPVRLFFSWTRLASNVLGQATPAWVAGENNMVRGTRSREQVEEDILPIICLHL